MLLTKPSMLRTASLKAAALASSLTCSSAWAADPEAGRGLAKRWCAACHVVAADQERKPTVAPPFVEIARKPGFDVTMLIEARKPPHPQIPPNLSTEQAADIAAYIATLAK